MAAPPRIRTPLYQHWRRFRLQLLPVICFALCVWATMFMWERQGRLANAIGEVEARRMDVISGLDGTLLELPGSTGYWQLFDRVDAGDTIAYFDPSEIDAQIATAKAFREELEKEIAAQTTNFRYANDQSRLIIDGETMKWRHQLRHQELATEGARIRAQIKVDKSELKRIQTRLSYAEPLSVDNYRSQEEAADLRRQRDWIMTRIAENEKVYTQTLKPQSEEVVKWLKEFEARRKSLINQDAPVRGFEDEELAKLLDPLRQRVQVQIERLRELSIQRQQTVLSAPMSGVITQIYHYPNQKVMAGRPIVTIADEDHGFILSYVRQQHHIRPEVGMKVAVRLRKPGSKEHEVTVDNVGPQFEDVPPQQLHDPNVPERGLPIQLSLPPEDQLQLRPGEIVDVVFRTR